MSTCLRERWATRLQVVAWVLVAALGYVPVAAGQSTGSGIIQGKVVDESGAVLPGVLVTATSPAMQGQRTVTTGEDGSYRLLDLPAGSYKVTYELEGFGTLVRTELALSVGFTLQIDSQLKVGALQDSVTVTGAAPMIDKATTMLTTNVTSARLASLPTTNTIYEIVGLAPGVRLGNTPDVGGSQLALQIGFKNYGLSNTHMQLLDGVNTNTGDGSGGGATFTDVLSWEEVKVSTAAQDSSIQLPGTFMLQVVKSGSNDFHGLAQIAGQNSTFQSDNIDEGLRAQGITDGNPLVSFTDYFGDLGGRLIRDKLWFYGALRRQEVRNLVLGYEGEHNLINSNQTTKFTYSPAQAYKIIGMAYRNYKHEPNRQASQFMPFESTLDYGLPNYVQKGEFQWVPTGKFLVNAMVYHFHWKSFFSPQPSADVPGNPARYDQNTQEYTGPQRYNASRGQFHRVGTDVTATMYPDREFLGGTHALRFGFHGYPYQQGRNLPVPMPAGDYQLTYDAGQPFQLVTYWWPTSVTRGTEYALFFDDQWRLDRFTFNLGVRWNRYRSWLPEQSSPASEFGPAVNQAAAEVTSIKDWPSIDPRLGVSWDIRGDGRSVLQTFYGRFASTPGYSIANTLNQNRKLTSTYRWNDPTGCDCYAPGSVNLARDNNPAFVTQTGGSNAIDNPDLQQSWTQQISTMFQQELAESLGMRAAYVYNRQTETSEINPRRAYGDWTIPIVRQDPGPDGALGTGDDGGDVTLWTYPASVQGARFEGTQTVNRPDGRPDIYHSVEFTFMKRRTNDLPWDASATFAATKNHRWLGGTNSSSKAAPLSPNEEFFPVDNTWDQEFKINGSYRLPYDINVAAVFRQALGAPDQRTYVFRNIPQVNTITIPLEEFGERRAPGLKLLNMKFTKKIGLGSNRRLSLDLDIFNVLNTNVPQGSGSGSSSPVVWVSGPTFGRPRAIVPPRIMRGGVSFSF
jgi:hypothetical protein